MSVFLKPRLHSPENPLLLNRPMSVWSTDGVQPHFSYSATPNISGRQGAAKTLFSPDFTKSHMNIISTVAAVVRRHTAGVFNTNKNRAQTEQRGAAARLKWTG